MRSLLQDVMQSRRDGNKSNDNKDEEEQMNEEVINQLTSGTALNTYVAKQESVLLEWKYEDLAEILNSSAEMRANLMRALTASVMKKVVNLYTSKNIGEDPWWKWQK